ncbi:MAG: hypothetical protein AAGA69_11075 [Pseudomonadota bacterium]
MTYLPLVLSLVTGLVIGLLLGASFIGVLFFMIFGFAGHAYGGLFPTKSERVYWIGLASVLLLIIVNLFGLSIHRYLLVAPLIVMAGHFASRITRRLSAHSS